MQNYLRRMLLVGITTFDNDPNVGYRLEGTLVSLSLFLVSIIEQIQNEL